MDNFVKKKKRRDVNRFGYFFIAPFFIGVVVFILYPMLDSFRTSLTDWQGFGSMNFIGLENYADILRSPLFYKTIRNTVLVWIAGSIPQIVVALVLASVINTRWFRGKGLFKVFYFLPNIVTAVFMGLLFSFLFEWQGGVVNMILMDWGWISEPIRYHSSPTWMLLICSAAVFLQWFGYQMIMIDSGMTGISRDIYEAAEVDGARGVKTFFHITMPLIRPILLYIVVTSLIGGFRLFDIPYALTGGSGDPMKSLLSMDMYLVNTAFEQSRYGYGAALGFLYCLVILFCTLVTRRLMNGRKEG